MPTQGTLVSALALRQVVMGERQRRLETPHPLAHAPPELTFDYCCWSGLATKEGLATEEGLATAVWPRVNRHPPLADTSYAPWLDLGLHR
jgi:hypothetical protein